MSISFDDWSTISIHIYGQEVGTRRGLHWISGAIGQVLYISSVLFLMAPG